MTALVQKIWGWKKRLEEAQDLLRQFAKNVTPWHGVHLHDQRRAYLQPITFYCRTQMQIFWGCKPRMQTGMVLTQRSRLPLGIDAGSHPVLEPSSLGFLCPAL
jgi:hypothetical protein